MEESLGFNMKRISSFIKSYIEDEEGKLGAIYEEAVANKVPVIRPETRKLLLTQLLLCKPMSILEIGTAVGYSSLYMSMHIHDDAKITTIELDEERIKIAKQNIKSMNKEKKITILQGDAAEVLKTLRDDAYDFAFVDAAKAQYIYYLPDVMRVVKSGGLIVSDNILQDGEVLESHFAVEKRDRTIHDRMRNYLYELTHNEELDTALLSVADGVALSVKKIKQKKNKLQ